ncbi:hypothetical protein ACSVIJ_04630 [Pseudomonas sp. NCHU5208]|uniref:hypothetical protein n=1 Tax=unclassified Pseudomonas TaxID=196821 RepID=UPI003F9B6B7A
MPIRKLISPERAQALSDPVVIGLALSLAVVCLALIWTVFSTLVDSGHIVTSILVMLPLAKGLSHYSEVTLRYFRPGWFIPIPGDAPSSDIRDEGPAAGA